MVNGELENPSDLLRFPLDSQVQNPRRGKLNDEKRIQKHHVESNEKNQKSFLHEKKNQKFRGNSISTLGFQLCLREGDLLIEIATMHPRFPRHRIARLILSRAVIARTSLSTFTFLLASARKFFARRQKEERDGRFFGAVAIAPATSPPWRQKRQFARAITKT